MRKYKALALLTLAAAPAARGAGYDCFVYPLTVSSGTATVSQVNAGQAVGYSQTSTGNTVVYNAVAWSPAAATYINLNPAGFTSVANGTDGTNQVGNGGPSGVDHALLWSGTASSYVDLNPTTLPGINNSNAISVSGNQQFGTGGNSSSYNLHPILWTGTAASAIDLATTNLPTSFASYFAEDTDGSNQVGAGDTGGRFSENGLHALLWSGKANTAVDLTPTDYPTLVNSLAFGVSGKQQVGVAYAQLPIDPFGGPYYEAMLWNGSGASAVILNPSNAFLTDGCEAIGTSGTQQVGVGYTTGALTGQAVLWSGTAASMVNLHSDLPATGSWNYSSAQTIDSSGVAYGTAVGKLNGLTGTFAAEWIPANSSGPIVVASGQNYQFAGNSAAGIFNRSIGGLTINGGGAAIIPASANSSNRQVLVITGTGLAIAGTTGNWTGSLNLANNDLDLPGASLATVSDQVKQGYNSGTWNGSDGIATTAAAGDTKHLTALGVIQNNQSGVALFTASHQFDGVTPGTTDVLVKYTYDGDTNFDGQVDGSDYANIDNGYLHKLTGWFNGDFNYDGTVNGSDYTLIDNSFNQQGAAISAAVATSTAQVGRATSVPEPGMGLVLVAGMLLARRRSTFRFSGRPESTPSAMAGDTGDTGETVPLRGDR